MRLLVLAPHPDDEILGCGGYLQRSVALGHAVKVVVLTDGDQGGDAAQRQQESIDGLAALGVAAPEFWSCPDGALPLGPVIEARYRQLLADWQPTHLLLPGPHEAHPDHRRLTRGVLAAATGHWQGHLCFYETTSPLPLVNLFEPIDLAQKLVALACHASQQAVFDYQSLARSLATLRGLSGGHAAAEGFLAYAWDGSAQNFFESRPLVSVVLRADDADFLRIALASLATQSYDQLEAIVVWHGAASLPVASPAGLPALWPETLAVRVLAGPGPRAANLNAGLAAAVGEYVVFLDQDDVLAPEHLACLLTELRAETTLDLVYGNYRQPHCRREDHEGSVLTVSVLDPGTVQGQPYARGRLLAGNYIPLHSFLCSLRLARQIGFDPQLEAYEDWDFLARAELAGANFRHVDATVCEYRLYPAADETADLASIHQRKGFLPWSAVVLDKLRVRLDLPAYTRLAELLRQRESERDAARATLAERTAHAAQLQQQLAQARQQLAQLADWADRLPGAAGRQALLPTDALSQLAGTALAASGPCIALLLPVWNTEPGWLAEAIQSVERQSYPHWQLCLADDGSTRPELRVLLERFAERARHDPRLRLLRRASSGGISVATNAAASLADAAWLAFLDHDDRLDPAALLRVAAAIIDHPQCHALYTDSRMIDRNGVLLHTFHKPGWAPETLRHINYVNHLSVVRRDCYTRLGGLQTGMDGSQDWDLWLRMLELPGFHAVHVAEPLYDWRATETSVAYSMASKPYAYAAACRATTAHLQRLGLNEVVSGTGAYGDGVRHQWAPRLQALTAIILTHNNAADLARLLAGLAGSDYPGLEVLIVANRVSDAATQDLLATAARRPGWRVVDDGQSFNWAALNNAAARRCQTPWLLFLNDDVELIGPQALQALARYLTLDAAIGAVGARLVYGPEPDAEVQHDGVVTDPQWVAANVTEGHAASDKGVGMPRNVSAVTGACLLTPRAAFVRCGGFDERLAVSFNDVDYCLHLRRLGYRIVVASDVTAIHRESRTRGALDSAAKREQLAAESHLMRQKWGNFLNEQFRLHYQHRFAGSRIVNVA